MILVTVASVRASFPFTIPIPVSISISVSVSIPIPIAISFPFSFPLALPMFSLSFACFVRSRLAEDALRLLRLLSHSLL